MKNRRKKKDIWSRIMVYTNFASWGLLISILLVFHRAQPEFETLFDRFYQLSLRTHWDSDYLYCLLILNTFGIILSLAGLILGAFRARRKEDHFRALVVTGITSMVLISAVLFWI